MAIRNSNTTTALIALIGLVATAAVIAIAMRSGNAHLERAQREWRESHAGDWSMRKGDTPEEAQARLEAFVTGPTPRAGHALFQENCASCHQTDGTGIPGLAPSIRNRDFLAVASDEFIRSTIKIGRTGTSMLARDDLSTQDVDSIIAYLRDIPVVNPVSFSVDPHKHYPGDAERGSDTYARYCASCHGENGEGYSAGGAGPAIGLPGFVGVASDDFIFQTVKHGRIGTPMRSFMGARGLADLSEQEVGDVIAFLRANVSNAVTAKIERDSAPEPPDPKKGHTLFIANCAQCHQKDGKGMPGLAPSIRNRDFLALASDEFIKSTVVAGRHGTSMIPRPDLLGNQLDHIVAYLRDLHVPVPVEVAVNANMRCEGNAESGEQLFTTYCASCHGPRGEGYSAGGSGPGIGLPGFLSVASDDYIFQTVKRGRIGTPMRPFIGPEGIANLQESDIHDVIVYLRSL